MASERRHARGSSMTSKDLLRRRLQRPPRLRARWQMTSPGSGRGGRCGLLAAPPEGRTNEQPSERKQERPAEEEAREETTGGGGPQENAQRKLCRPQGAPMKVWKRGPRHRQVSLAGRRNALGSLPAHRRIHKGPKDHRGHSSEKGDSSSWRRASGRSSGGAPEGGVLSQEGTLRGVTALRPPPGWMWRWGPP